VVYTDSALGFSVSHPPDWETCTDTGRSLLFCAPPVGGPSFPTFYVTVIPPGFTNDDASAYNFVAEATVQAFEAQPVGGSHTTGDPAPEFSVYTRLPDVVIGGEAGVVVENVRVWEGEPGTVDRRAFVHHGENLYMIGAYYSTPEELEIFQTIFATFRFEG
jgi:hypothetical protein